MRSGLVCSYIGSYIIHRIRASHVTCLNKWLIDVLVQLRVKVDSFGKLQKIGKSSKISR